MTYADRLFAGFYRRPLKERVRILRRTRDFSSETEALIAAGGGLSLAVADTMTENVIAVHGLPLSVATNFRVNGRDRLLPMAIEEPSVVAAVSHGAKLVKAAGGFLGVACAPVMTAQVQLENLPDVAKAVDAIRSAKQIVIDVANVAIPSMVRRGGGCEDLEVRVPAPEEGWLVVHLYIDVRDSMGANVVDSAAEAAAPALAELTAGDVGLRIVSNLPLRRMVSVTCEVRAEELGGSDAAARVARASRFAMRDPFRAVTHNKGIMNGVDAVALATGQDWRAIEAGAHAFAAINGRYEPLSQWTETVRGLRGGIVMPLATGIVGGCTAVHPGARAAIELLKAKDTADLAIAMAGAGLCANLAALRALSGEGIQRGHMRLHSRKSTPPEPPRQPVGCEAPQAREISGAADAG